MKMTSRLALLVACCLANTASGQAPLPTVPKPDQPYSLRELKKARFKAKKEKKGKNHGRNK